MNFLMKPLPLLVSAIALSLSIIAVAPAVAQSPASRDLAQRGQTRRPNFLNLTAEQQTQIEQIRENERSQIAAILTEEQLTQLQQEMQNRQPGSPQESRGTGRSPFESLDLTDEQRSQIEAVIRTSREQMDAVLTSEQRQQLQQYREQHEQLNQSRIPHS